MHRPLLMADLFLDEDLDVPLQLGEQQTRCEFCQGDYSVYLEVDCDECERPLCPLCATRSGSTYHCPECRPTCRVATPKPEQERE
jgi:hypothetical protein